MQNTVKNYVSRVITVYEEGFDIEIGKLPKLNQKNVKKPMTISYNDLPDKDFLRHILKMMSPLMKVVILFMISRGCAKRETLNITIQDFIDATYDYHHRDGIDGVIEALHGRDDVVSSWRLRRQKSNKLFTKNKHELKVARLSNIYGVSKQSIVYKLNNSGFINDGLKNEWIIKLESDNQIMGEKDTERRRNSEPHISTISMKRKQDGTSYTRLILEAYDNDIITSTQAMRYLDTSLDKIKGLDLEIRG